MAIVRMRRELLARISPEYNASATYTNEIDYRSLRALAEVIPSGTDIAEFTEMKRQERIRSFQ